jgi:hypothetical protein
MIRSLTALPFLETVHALVKEYSHLHGLELRFETICLDTPSRKPQRHPVAAWWEAIARHCTTITKEETSP